MRYLISSHTTHNALPITLSGVCTPSNLPHTLNFKAVRIQLCSPELCTQLTPPKSIFCPLLHPPHPADHTQRTTLCAQRRSGFNTTAAHIHPRSRLATNPRCQTRHIQPLTRRAETAAWFLEQIANEDGQNDTQKKKGKGEEYFESLSGRCVYYGDVRMIDTLGNAALDYLFFLSFPSFPSFSLQKCTASSVYVVTPPHG
jgi:hypothetical protein